MTARAKRRPGASIPEAQRHTVAVKLRLAPDVREQLAEIVTDSGYSTSEIVTEMIRADHATLVAGRQRAEKRERP
jgi:hypothetical protein